MESTLRIDIEKADPEIIAQEVIAELKKMSKIMAYYFQLEIGTETGKPHLQGYVTHKYTDNYFVTRSAISVYCKVHYPGTKHSLSKCNKFPVYQSYIHKNEEKALEVPHWTSYDAAYILQLEAGLDTFTKKTTKNKGGKSVTTGSFAKRLYDELHESCVQQTITKTYIILYHLIPIKIYEYCGEFFQNKDYVLWCRCVEAFTCSLEYYYQGPNAVTQRDNWLERFQFEHDIFNIKQYKK